MPGNSDTQWGTDTQWRSLSGTNQRVHKCKNTTVPQAMSAKDSAKSAYICDQDPDEDDIREGPAEVSGAWQAGPG